MGHSGFSVSLLVIGCGRFGSNTVPLFYSKFGDVSSLVIAQYRFMRRGRFGISLATAVVVMYARIMTAAGPVTRHSVQPRLSFWRDNEGLIDGGTG